LLYIGVLQLLTVILSCVNIFVALKLLPNFRFNFSPISTRLRSQLLGFSGLYFLAGIFTLIIHKIGYLVIGIILGVKAVAIYSIAFGIHNNIRTLNNLIGNPLYYTIIGEFAKRDKNDRDSMIINATRMYSGILIPIVIITLISVNNFILSWVGERFSGSILPCKILLSYLCFQITREILYQGVVGGKGKPIETVKVSGFVAIANLGLSLLLVKFIGITGIALGTATPSILASFFYVYRFCKILSIPVLGFIRQAVAPNLPHFLLSLVLSIVAQGFMKSGNVFQVLAIMAAIYGITLVAGYSLLPPENRRIIRKVVVLRA